MAARRKQVVKDDARDQAIILLWRLGWLEFDTVEEARKETTESHLRCAIRAYRQFHGLSISPEICPALLRSLEAFRFCQHPDVMPIQEELNRWPDPNIAFWVDPQSLVGLPVSADVAIGAIDWGWSQWAKVCGIKPRRVADASQAHVKVAFGSIDGPGKVLAYSELADNSMRQKGQKYDSQERWAFGLQVPRYSIDLGRVSCHEIGHVLGLPHIANGNLLQPMYSETIAVPQAGDIQEVQSRYGPALASNPAPVNPPAQSPFVLRVEGTGQILSVSATGFETKRA